MDDETIIRFLNTHYPKGVTTRTENYFNRKGEKTVAVKDECYNRKLLNLECNQGVWVYNINPRGEACRDSKALH